MSETLRELKWDELYRDKPVEEMPWYCAGLDPDVVAALGRFGITRGRVLDLGTGPGTQAVALAARGFEVTATDISAHAVEKAKLRAGSDGAEIEYRVDDILATKLSGPFDLLLDRGCFHVLAPECRGTYVNAVRGLLRDDGHLLLKTFSRRETREDGPHRFSPAEIEAQFRPGFRVESAEETEFRGPVPRPIRALFCVLRAV